MGCVFFSRNLLHRGLVNTYPQNLYALFAHVDCISGAVRCRSLQPFYNSWEEGLRAEKSAVSCVCVDNKTVGHGVINKIH